MDGRAGRYHTCARTRRSGLPDGQRTNDCVLLRLPRPSYPKKEIEKERKMENRSRDEALGLRCFIMPRGHHFIHVMLLQFE